MADIKAGRYTIGEIFDAAGFDFEAKAAADYLNGGADHRRVKVGGLSFDSVDETLVIPVTADEVVITLDGKTATKLTVSLDEEQREERRRSFESAADASELTE